MGEPLMTKWKSVRICMRSTLKPKQQPTPTKPATPDTFTTATPRVPSIRFLGKEGWQRALTAEVELVIPVTYGRLDFSEEEIEALLSGGANIAPEIKEYSE